MSRVVVPKSTEAGFTLVELLVVMIVMSVISLTLANFITSWLQASSLAQIRANLLTNAEFGLDTITNDIRLSGSADDENRWADPNAPGNQFGWDSNSQTLVLAEIATDKNNNVIFSDPSEYITQKDNQIYYLSGSTLYRRTLVSNSSNDAAITTCPRALATSACPADKTIATGVTSWSINYYDASEAQVSPTDARSIQISITLSAPLNSQTISASYSTRMVFRND